MSVLQRKELEDSPLADLHAIASELGVEGYRGLRREDLIAAVLNVQGGDSEPDSGSEPEAEAEAEPSRVRRARSRGRGRGRGRGSRDSEDSGEEAESNGGADSRRAADDREDDEEPADAAPDADAEIVTGTLDVLANGSGFLRVEGEGKDVYVSPAQIRRCELRAGDEVTGPVRPPRRNERHPSLVRVEQINGLDAEAPEQRAKFSQLTAVHATERLSAPSLLDSVPFGKGSRVAIAGVSGAGATRVLREVVAALTAGQGDLSVSVVLAGARPEEVTEWQREGGAPISGGSFDISPDEAAQAAELAVERAKRVVERGGDAVVVVDSLAVLNPGAARRLFGAGRKAEEGGSLTVIATVGDSSEHLRIASTRIVLEPGKSGPAVVADRSGTLRADLLS